MKTTSEKTVYTFTYFLFNDSILPCDRKKRLTASELSIYYKDYQFEFFSELILPSDLLVELIMNSNELKSFVWFSVESMIGSFISEDIVSSYLNIEKNKVII